jgi:hypothetical protein
LPLGLSGQPATFSRLVERASSAMHVGGMRVPRERQTVRMLLPVDALWSSSCSERAFTSGVEIGVLCKANGDSDQPCYARLCRLGAPFRLILEASLELMRSVSVGQWNDTDSTFVRGIRAVAKIIKLPRGSGLMHQGCTSLLGTLK